MEPTADRFARMYTERAMRRRQQQEQTAAETERVNNPEDKEFSIRSYAENAISRLRNLSLPQEFREAISGASENIQNLFRRESTESRLNRLRHEIQIRNLLENRTIPRDTDFERLQILRQRAQVIIESRSHNLSFEINRQQNIIAEYIEEINGHKRQREVLVSTPQARQMEGYQEALDELDHQIRTNEMFLSWEEEKLRELEARQQNLDVNNTIDQLENEVEDTEANFNLAKEWMISTVTSNEYITRLMAEGLSDEEILERVRRTAEVDVEIDILDPQVMEAMRRHDLWNPPLGIAGYSSEDVIGMRSTLEPYQAQNVAAHEITHHITDGDRAISRTALRLYRRAFGEEVDRWRWWRRGEQEYLDRVTELDAFRKGLEYEYARLTDWEYGDEFTRENLEEVRRLAREGRLTDVRIIDEIEDDEAFILLMNTLADNHILPELETGEPSAITPPTDHIT